MARKEWKWTRGPTFAQRPIAHGGQWPRKSGAKGTEDCEVQGSDRVARNAQGEDGRL